MVGVKHFDEDAVLASALTLFWRKGLNATSMADLAAVTGVQRGSLYNAYGDKERLFLLAFNRYAKNFLESANSALADPDPRAAVATFFDAAIASMTNASRGCLTTKTATEIGRVSNAIERRLRGLIDELQDMVGAALSSETARHALTMEPSAAAELIVVFTRGLAIMERFHGDPVRLRRTAADLVNVLFP